MQRRYGLFLAALSAALLLGGCNGDDATPTQARKKTK